MALTILTKLIKGGCFLKDENLSPITHSLLYDLGVFFTDLTEVEKKMLVKNAYQIRLQVYITDDKKTRTDSINLLTS